MKKRAIFSLAMASMLGVATVMAGCGGTDESTIKFYTFGETPAELIAYKAMVDDFNATIGKDEGIKVAYSPKTDGDYESLIIRTGSSQNGPDIYMVPEKEFKAWTRIYADLPSIDGIFAGKETRIPKSTDQLYALTSSMITRARANRGDWKSVGNSIDYALKMPPDFACVLLKGYQDIDEEFSKKLLEIPAFVRWLNTRGKLLNGIIK